MKFGDACHPYKPRIEQIRLSATRRDAAERKSLEFQKKTRPGAVFRPSRDKA
jgi:hypothetical protein